MMPRPAITATLALLALGLLWLAVPALALAGDCPDDSGAYCYAKWAAASPALAMAAGALILGAALWGALSSSEPPPPPPKKTYDYGGPSRSGRGGLQPGPYAKPPPSKPKADDPGPWQGVKKWFNDLFE